MNIFTLMGTILVDNAKANESISKTGEESQKLVTKIDKSITKTAQIGVAVGAAVVSAGTALYGMAAKSAEATDRIDKLSQKIGMSRETFQEWDFIASQSGMSVEQLQGGFKTLTAQIDKVTEGNKNATGMFQKLGVSVKDSNGKIKTQEQIFEELVIQFQHLEDGTEKARLATELFGKSGSELMPLLNGAAGSVEEMKEKARELGIVISSESIDAGVKFTDTIDQLKRSFGAVVTNIGVEVMPILQELADNIISKMPEIQESISNVFNIFAVFITFILENSDGIVLFGTVLAGILATLKGYLIIQQVTEIMKKWEVVTKLQTVAQWLLNTAMEANVIGLIVIAIAAVITGLIYWISKNDELRNKIIELSKTIVEDFKKTLEWFKDLPKKLYENGKEAMQNFFDGFKEPWQKFEDWINDKLGWLEVKVAKYDVSGTKAQDAAGGKKRVDGSHYNGLERVPYDGYIAEVHKDEMILTAKEATELRKNKASSDTYNFTIDAKNVKEFNDIIEIVKNKRRITRMGVSEN